MKRILPIIRTHFFRFAFVLAFPGLTACGEAGGGSCVIETISGRPSWSVCYDDYTDADCEERREVLDSEVQHAPSTCEARGFTKKCSGEYGYRLSTYSC